MTGDAVGRAPGPPPSGPSDPGGDEIDRLRREREAAQRRYDEALARLDEAVRPLREPPAPAESDAGAAPVWEPPPPRSGWRRGLRRVRRLLARAAVPGFERQADFNRAVAAHLGELAARRRAEREASERLVAFLRHEVGALATWESLLVQYAQRIMPYVDTRDREAAGLLRQGMGSGLESVAAAQRGLDESFALLDASTRVVRRELQRLRTAPPAPSAAAGDSGRKRTAEPAPSGAAEAAPAAPGGAEDEASPYVGFEDVFRGRHEDITERQRAYLPYFDGAADVLDIGCGRGEFLELLRERGVAGRGIDTNAEMVARCVERGLAVAAGDALAHLRTLPDGSVGGLFSAQVVEHLDPRYLVRLLQETHRVLRPGGRAVIETINPASWTAFFSAYLRDITHRQPLHPDTLQHLLRAAGFVDVDVVYSAPPPEAMRLERLAVDPALAVTPHGAALAELAGALNRNVDRLNGLLFAEQDYAAIATRQEDGSAEAL